MAEQMAPMSATQPPAVDPATEPTGEAGYKICIAVYPDNTFATYREPLEPEGPAGAGDGPGSGKGELLDNFEDALRSAVAIFEEQPPDASAQEAFESGFGEAPKAGV